CRRACRARPSHARRASRAWASARPARFFAARARPTTSLRLVVLVEVALHVGCAQQLVDALRFVKTLVDAKPDLGREFHVDAMSDFTAQKALVALECGEHLACVATAERHHVDGGEPQVGGDTHLRHGDHVIFDHRVMYFAAGQDLGQRVADELAGTQLALRRCCSRAAMMRIAGHSELTRYFANAAVNRRCGMGRTRRNPSTNRWVTALLA